MHELSIAMSIVDLATKEAKKSKASRVMEIELEIGRMAGVKREALEFSLHVAMQHTPLDGAKIDIVEIEPLAVCRDCRVRFSPVSGYEPCPHCHSLGVELLRGRELRLKSLLVE